MTSFIIVSLILFLSILAIMANNRLFAREFKNKLKQKDAEIQKLGEREETLQRELTTLQEKLSHAIEDPVTKLMGLQLFEDRLNQSVKESARYNLIMGVLFIDIDDFHMINEVLGFDQGDQLLFAVAQRLEVCVRQVDSVSRYAKDTFVVLLSQLNKAETAAVVSQRMLQSLAQPFQLSDREMYVTASIGIAIYPQDGQDGQSLLRKAERALQQSQDKSRHSYQFYQERENGNSNRELSILNSLRRENIFQELRVHYQPIFDMKDKTVLAMDAMIQWQHPELGLIKQNDLYHYAERQRKLNGISEWLLQHACKQFTQWRSIGFTPAYICLPMTSAQLINTQFIYRISQILQELNMQPAQLILTLKDKPDESTLVSVEKSLNMLNYLGVKLAIEDFGVGGFPISYLKSMRVSYVKLDPTLIKDIETNHQALEMIKSLLSLTQNLSAHLVAVDVRTQEQAELLLGIGCTLMQGQLLAAPISEQDVPEKLLTH